MVSRILATLAAVCLLSSRCTMVSGSPTPKAAACKNMVTRNELRFDVLDCTGRKVGDKTCQVKVS